MLGKQENSLQLEVRPNQKKIEQNIPPFVENFRRTKNIMSVLLRTILPCTLFLLLKTVIAQEVTQAHKDSLNSLVDEYYDLNLKIFQEGSTIEDIDQVFLLFTDDFVYVHPKYGGTYTRQDLYNGYTRNQKNGGYDGSVVDIKVLRRITGLNAVVAQKVFVTNEEGKIAEGDPQMTLFEFENGKIVRIYEYW